MNLISRLTRKIERVIHARQAYKFFLKDWIALGDLEAAARVVGTMRFSRSLEPLPTNGPQGKRIVVLAPHPDDEIIGPGGTLIKAIAAGASVHVIYLTSGRPAEETERETLEVAKEVGYSTSFLRFPLGAIPIDDETLGIIGAALEEYRPTALFVPFLLDDHDDHRRVSDLLRHASKKGLVPPSCEVWAFQVYTALWPNVVVDITAEADAKARAIRGWSAQMKRRDWAHYALGLNAFNQRWLATGGQAAYAEAFFVLPVQDYVDVCDAYFDMPEATVYYTDAYVAGRV